MTTAPFDTSARRLDHAIERSAVSGSEVARRMGLTRGAISKWRRGHRHGPDSEQCRELGLLLKVNPAWLAMLSDEMAPGPLDAFIRLPVEIENRTDKRTPTGPAPGKDLRSLPLCGAAAAGEPMAKIYEATDIQWFDFSESFLKAMYRGKWDPERAVMLRVDGHSMEGELPHGSIVFVDRGPGAEGFDRVNDDDIYMVRPPDEEGITLKRVSIDGQVMQLLPAGAAVGKYKVRHFSLKGRKIQTIVRGRVVGKFEIVGRIGKVL